MASDRNDAAGYLGWFFLGGIIGAAAALLVTPKTGRETREMLSSGEWARKAQTMATEAQGRAGEWLDKSRELFEEQTQRLMTAFEAGKDAMRDEMKKGPTPPRG
jgi:gas vesicle protein